MFAESFDRRRELCISHEISMQAVREQFVTLQRPLLTAVLQFDPWRIKKDIDEGNRVVDRIGFGKDPWARH